MYKKLYIISILFIFICGITFSDEMVPSYSFKMRFVGDVISHCEVIIGSNDNFGDQFAASKQILASLGLFPENQIEEYLSRNYGMSTSRNQRDTEIGTFVNYSRFTKIIVFIKNNEIDGIYVIQYTSTNEVFDPDLRSYDISIRKYENY